MSVTILFRGLMVFHKMGDYMEIGFLNAPGQTVPPPPNMEEAGHVPRILTLRDGVITSVFDLRSRPELDRKRPWELEVTNPLQPTATTYTNGPRFDRLTHTDDKDFRWIADLEGPDLHNRDLTAELNKGNLRFVLSVRHGEFNTRTKSRSQNRQSVNTGQVQKFGCAAEVVGCHIAFNIGTLKLKAEGSTLFTFADNLVYEISNTPPDVPTAAPPNKPYGPGAGHFHMYYHHLFKQHPADEFDLMPEDDPDPAPDPFLCGVAALGRSTEGL